MPSHQLIIAVLTLLISLINGVHAAIVRFLEDTIALLQQQNTQPQPLAREDDEVSVTTTSEVIYTPATPRASSPATIGRSQPPVTPSRSVVFKPVWTPHHRSNAELRRHLKETGECTHACHQRNIKNFANCPVCETAL